LVYWPPSARYALRAKRSYRGSEKPRAGYVGTGDVELGLIAMDVPNGTTTERATPNGDVSLAEQAYQDLKNQILKNKLPPGYQALEQDFTQLLGMSRTPVREALIRLENEGLVELLPRRGARVLPVSPADMKEIYELLTNLEPHAAAGLAEYGVDPDDLAILDEATTTMERAIKERHLDEWAEADDRFHRSLIDLCGNRRLADFVKTLYDQAHRARLVTLYLRKLPVASTRDHRKIVNAIANGDAAATRRIFKAHRERAAKELLEILNRHHLSNL